MMNIRKIELKNYNYSKMTIGQTESIIGLMRTDSLIGSTIPLEPNPRRFMGGGNKNYNKMMYTLSNEPHLFNRKNASGITIFASGYEVNEKGNLVVFLSEEDGIANGGHTYEACRNFGNMSAYVKVTVELGLDKKDVVDIAESLNLSKRINTHSLENKRGTFDKLKKILGDSNTFIIYYEGDTGYFNVRELVAAMNIFHYSSTILEKDITRQTSNSYSAGSHIVKRANNDSFIEQFNDIVVDIYKLHTYIVRDHTMLETCQATKKAGWKRRLPNGEYGLARALSFTLLMGIAHVGTELNSDGVLVWKQGYNTEALRTDFIHKLFMKTMDVLIVEEGLVTVLIKRESTMKKVLAQAEFIDQLRTNKLV